MFQRNWALWPLWSKRWSFWRWFCDEPALREAFKLLFSIIAQYTLLSRSYARKIICVSSWTGFTLLWPADYWTFQILETTLGVLVCINYTKAILSFRMIYLLLFNLRNLQFHQFRTYLVLLLFDFECFFLSYLLVLSATRTGWSLAVDWVNLKFWKLA